MTRIGMRGRRGEVAWPKAEASGAVEILEPQRSHAELAEGQGKRHRVARLERDADLVVPCAPEASSRHFHDPTPITLREASEFIEYTAP